MVALCPQPVYDVLESDGGADAGRLEFHGGALLEGAGAKDPLQHPDDIGADCLRLVDARLGPDVDPPNLLGKEVVSLNQLQDRRCGHGGGVLVGIGDRHLLDADSSCELLGLDPPRPRELAEGRYEEAGDGNCEVVDPDGRF